MIDFHCILTLPDESRAFFPALACAVGFCSHAP